MTKTVLNKVIKSISFVPGLVGLSNVDFTKKPTLLKEENWDKGISTEKQGNVVELKIGAIISSNIRSKIIASEIHSSVKAVLKKEGIKSRVIIYIRGVK